jgi:hypothetical protein
MVTVRHVLNAMFLSPVVQIPQNYTPPPADSPGKLRWGRGAGCDFITRSVREWSSRYFCKVALEQGCTFDNRMVALCQMSSTIVAPLVYSKSQVDTYSVSAETISGDECLDDTHCPLPYLYRV